MRHFYLVIVNLLSTNQESNTLRDQPSRQLRFYTHCIRLSTPWLLGSNRRKHLNRGPPTSLLRRAQRADRGMRTAEPLVDQVVQSTLNRDVGSLKVLQALKREKHRRSIYPL
ncbi:hypothetical protein KC19_VG043700 [Ceratodon purpureus]|uniref:Uncharacterized protein n=1 Tax=Ceratodon purpureus TaxID=3225 RepID=A0A8T0HLS8_CERPU|nr:hypothetical protein KC19_VG043700 [Ceratodon purpureus]